MNNHETAEKQGRITATGISEAGYEELCRRTISRLNEAYDHDPVSLENRIDHTVRALVSLRDKLIVDIRGGAAGEGGAKRKKALADVNRALSLLVSLDYPAIGIDREMMEKAEELLRYLALNEFRDM
ncbi:MAG TPA: hypothetical protein VGJ94_06185 [Syntrophorhabdaceae bacterium]|jgi:hypothetical protein